MMMYRWISLLCLLLLVNALAIGQAQEQSKKNRDARSLSSPKFTLTDDDDGDDDDDDDDDDEDEPEVHPTLYFVKLDPTLSNIEVDELLDDMNSEEIWYIPELDLHLWEVIGFPYATSENPILDINSHIGRARKKTKIKESNFNVGYQLATPNLTNPNSCYDALDLVGLLGQNSIKISILDTGISNLQDNTGNYHFGLTQFTGFDYIDDDEIPDDLHGHGTHIAGLIHHLLASQGGHGNISFDIRKTHNALGQGFLSELIPAVVDAVKADADIINMSFGYQDLRIDEYFKPLQLAIDYAEENEVLLVASAGNFGKDNDEETLVSFPASFPNPNILSVASNDCGDQLSAFSSFGSQSVDVSILGENIPGPDLGSGLTHNTGTSFSSAIVAGLAAILGSHQASFNIEGIKCALINNSRPVAHLSDRIKSNGVIDFPAALLDISSCTDQVPVSSDDVEDFENDQFIIFPNPTQGMAWLQLDGNWKGEAQLYVLNQMGQVLVEKRLNLGSAGSTHAIEEVGTLASGTYFVKLIATNRSFTRKIIKR